MVQPFGARRLSRVTSARLRKLSVGLFVLVVLQAAALAQGAWALSVSGTVTAQSGSASLLLGTTVTVRDHATQATVATSSTDLTGAYGVTVSSGTYDVRFDPPALSGYQPSTVESYVVTSNQTLNVVLVPSGAATLSGVVRDGSGAPLPAGMYLSLTGTNGTAQTTTTSGGAYSLSVVPGSYQLRVNSNGTLGSTYFDIYNNVTIAANRSQDLAIPLRTVRIRVQSPAGLPVANVGVSVDTTSAGMAPIQFANDWTSGGGQFGASSQQTDSSGDVITQLLPTTGAHQARLAPPTGSGFANSNFQLPAITQDTTVNATLVAAATLSGVVRDGSGAPLPAGMYLSLTGTNGTAQTTTTSGGAYSLSVVPGSYQLRVNSNGTLGSTYFDIYNNVTIAANRSQDLAIPLRTVRIRVQSPAGLPVANVGVSVDTTSAGMAPIQFANDWTSGGGQFGASSQQTDSSGDVITQLLPTTGAHQARLAPPTGSGFANSNFQLPAITQDTTVIAQLTSSDTTAPIVSCGSADGAWHASNIAIACTASDSGTGLASPGDSSFSISTSVNAGAEDANATAGPRQVCDQALNCATASVSGNKIDRKGPSITLTNPTSSGTYFVGQSVSSSYSCTDGGSGTSTCAGTVANGSPINTATSGSKTFTVNATDAVGNTSSQTVTYSVGVDNSAPLMSCGFADSAWHPLNVSISCTASDTGSGLANAGDAAFQRDAQRIDGHAAGL